jgi:hypothetical protein
MSNGVKNPTITHTMVPVQLLDGKPSVMPVQVSVPPAGGGFNDSSGFQAGGVNAAGGLVAPSDTVPVPPVGTEAAENHGQERSRLAHAFNTLRKSLHFMNHKGNPNAQQATDAEIRDAVSTLAKSMGINLDTSKGTAQDVFNKLAQALGLAPAPTTPSTPVTSPAPSAPSTSASTDPMALLQQMIQKVLGSTH